MSLNTFLVQPLSDTPNSRTRRLPNSRITVLESSIDVWPYLVHVWTDKLGASLHNDTKCHECRTALVWVSALGIFEHFLVEAREDLLRREGGCEGVESTDTELYVLGLVGACLVGLRNATYASWGFFVIIIGFSLHEKWHERINQMWGQLEIVDLCLFANGSSVRSNTAEWVYEDILLNGHNQRIERHNTVLLIKVGFAACLDAECDDLANMLRQQRRFLERSSVDK